MVRDAAESRGGQAATRRRILTVGERSRIAASVTHGKAENYEHEPRSGGRNGQGGFPATATRFRSN